ncbi:MAG: DNA polymerase III subunit gamma/tau [Verrucomicrobia bacterium]|nr:DNA polymerase III subunit gamma/tau [Verrucomicrobiota bacterium]
MYQSLPRKYRPQTFQALVGQEAIVTTLKNALKYNRVAHAYLFCGSRGTGKTSVARLFAKALNCSHLTADFEPCNQCTSCQEITAGRSLDVLEIDGASNRGIDDIRQINETVGYASSAGKYKIYIIDEVHMLTKEAFNALLKTLEEPPPNVKFFFATTEPHKMPATIISRCQRFDFGRLSTEIIVHKLRSIASDQKANVEDAALELIAHLAEGGLRDAESLFDQLLCYSDGPITYDSVAKSVSLSPRSYYFRLDEAIADRNLSFAFTLSEEIFSSGKEIASFLDGLVEHLRTLLLLKLSLPLSTYLSEADKKSYSTSEKLYSEEECLYMLDYVMGWYKELSKIPFKQSMLEMILLHLLRSKQRIPLPTLVRRLIEIDKGQEVATPATIAPPAEVSKEKLVEVQSTALPASKSFATTSKDEIAIAPPPPETTRSQQSRYDTLLRFAAIELEGSVKP